MFLPRPCLSCGKRTEPGRSRGRTCNRGHRASTRRHGTPAERRAATRRRERLAPGDGAAKRLRRAVNKQGGSLCARCVIYYPAPLLRIDHRVALFLGGIDVDENVQSLCVRCHGTKTSAEQSATRLTT